MKWVNKRFIFSGGSDKKILAVKFIFIQLQIYLFFRI